MISSNNAGNKVGNDDLYCFLAFDGIKIYVFFSHYKTFFTLVDQIWS